MWTGSYLNGIHCIIKSKLKNQGGTVISDFSLNAETKFTEGKVLSNNYINDIVRDHNGNLWILLFRDNILTKFNPTTRSLIQFDIYNLTKGYPTNIAIDK